MKEVTMCCTTCPSGCALVVTVDGDKVVKVEGNTCKRGIKFAENAYALSFFKKKTYGSHPSRHPAVLTAADVWSSG